MPDGAAVIRYDGKRVGRVWRIKFKDASGKQVSETLGKARDGWTKRKAEAALRARLTDVERDGYRRPEQTSFGAFLEEWRDEYPVTKGLKYSTRKGYESIVDVHLVPTLGSLNVTDIGVSQVERYIAGKRRAGLSEATVNRHLNVLSLVMRSAVRRGLARANPVGQVERPKERLTDWRILSPAEVALVEQAFTDLIGDVEPGSEEHAWRQTARVAFLTLQEAGLRAGELRGLRWKHTALADPDVPHLRVEETLVRGRVTTPKSDASRRTVPISSALASELFEHRARSVYQGDDERLFVSPHRGSPLNEKRYAATFRTALAKAGIREYMRPCHDGRHSAITNAARHGRGEMALMTIAGHSDSRTTRRYTHLAGVMFAGEGERMGGGALWGASRNTGRNQTVPSPVEETKDLA
jgi:integrase